MLFRSKEQRANGNRAERHEHEEEQQRQAAAAGAPATGAPDEEAPTNASPSTAADVTPAPPFNAGSVEGEEEAAFRFGGRDRMKEFADRAELRPSASGDHETVWLNGQQIGTIANLRRSRPDQEPVWDADPFFGLDHSRNSRSQSRDTAIANLVVRALQDGPADPANPSDDVWDTVTVKLAGMTRELPALPKSLANNAEARARHERLSALIDAFRAQQSPSGNLRDDLAQARDEFAWLRGALPDVQRGGEARDALTDLDTRSFWAGRILDALGTPESDLERPRALDEPESEGEAPSPAVPTPEVPVNTPEPPARPSAEPEPEGTPDPIDGQPAHWARVADLNPGDMVRISGTTRGGRRTERAGYAYNGPVRIEVTRRGRTEEMLRPWVTANPDGTGPAGNV